jgi:hypothetical protein
LVLTLVQFQKGWLLSQWEKSWQYQTSILNRYDKKTLS